MRYVDSYTPAQLGLTEEELAFLQPEAEARFQAFAIKTGYNREDVYNPRKLFSDHTGQIKGKSAELDAITGTLLHALIYSAKDENVFGEVVTETKLDAEGFGLQHSSYGAVSVGNPSGNSCFLVGSAALSQYAKSISINYARVYDDRDGSLDVHAEAKRSLELTLSAEQFIMMVRGDSGFKTPCGLMIRDGMRSDMPPSTNFDQHESKDFAAEINALTKPVAVLLSQLKALIDQGASKKGEYAAMVELAQQAAAEYARIAPAVLEMANAKGAQEGKRAHRQFVTEMNERLGQLNIDRTLSQLLGLAQG